MRFSFMTLTTEAISTTNNPDSDDKTERYHQALQRILHEPTSQLYKFHAKLDQLVLQAYGFNLDDLLEKLLTLNLELAEKEKCGEAIVVPWAPQAT
jgi:hypothetical protein